MKKIDRDTVSRILDAADIVEVVSDFVSLKRSGANYMGLCPFHSERTPSFSVSKSKGICKCFSCGKGGSPVNFLMELEQMSYQEALRWLARKYNITIEEHEETPEERKQASEREALFAINTFALSHFEKNLHENEDGRNIGLAYFIERGLSLETIRKFQLGYALEKSTALYEDAVNNGYSEEYLVKTGLCSRSERGIYDRFKGRVIYPVHSISGKIVAFGGRTLKSDKTVAKYVNSPESDIYSKSRQLYGLFQARRSIVKEDKCILVEGYMDVLSMSQSGIENVVASSGTSLTDGQINLIHRFTNNVTVIYDADAAGIKASLRGVDMLLSEGINVKVVLFPEGEDPDSYARTHTREELKSYLEKNETDFITFKSSVLLKEASDDPIKRSEAINDILVSISKIPNPITRQVYLDQVSRTFNMDAKVLALQVAKDRAKNAETAYKNKLKQQSDSTANVIETQPGVESVETKENKSDIVTDTPLKPFELAIARYLVRYGLIVFSQAFTDSGEISPVTVLDYVLYEFTNDELGFTDPVILNLFEEIINLNTKYEAEEPQRQRLNEATAARLKEEGIKKIQEEATSKEDIIKKETLLENEIETALQNIEVESRRNYLEKNLLSHPDSSIRKLVTDLAAERHQLSRVHSRFAPVVTEQERLSELVPRAIFELKDAILHQQINELNARIKEVSNDSELTQQLLQELIEKTKIRAEFAKYLGERIVTP